MNPEPEYGNETACANCGDEWATLDERGHCPECAKVIRAYDETPNHERNQP